MSDQLLLKGIAANPGVVEGLVRVILPQVRGAHLDDGEILATTLTDPTMVAAYG